MKKNMFDLSKPLLKRHTNNRSIKNIDIKTDNTAYTSIKGAVAQNKPVIKPTLSAKQQEDLLAGYDIVLSEQWPLLKRMDHIRYKRKDGQFRRGGFVMKQWLDINNITDDTTGKRMIKLSINPFQPNATTWDIAYIDIDTIWKKHKVDVQPTTAITSTQQQQHPQQPQPTLMQPSIAIQLTELMENYKQLREHIDLCRADINQLQSEQKNIVALIRRFHQQ